MGFRRKPGAHGAEHVTEMAIYSFNHDTFGKTTNRAGAAGGNAAYNARENETRFENAGNELLSPSAASNAAYNAREEVTYAVRSHVIPPGPKEAEAWFHAQEQGERKNARMSDRFIGGLPRELTPERCIEVVEKFCREVTQDRVPWHFALHLELDKKNDPDWNPHAHIIFRDRDIETGRRFLYTSAGPKEHPKLAEKGIRYWTTKDFREKWGADLNHALERAGYDARVDHRSLKEQGIDREPQIHIGPGSQRAASKGYPLDSRDHQRGDRTIPYSLLDQGTRAEHNAGIVEANKRQVEPNLSSPLVPRASLKLRVAQRIVRNKMYREQKRDRDALRQVQKAQLDQHKAWAKKLYADARQSAFEQVREQTADKWATVRAIEDAAKRDEAAKALQRQQKNLYAKASALHVAQARIEKNQAWQGLQQDQRQERLDLRATHRKEYTAVIRQHIAERVGTSEQHHAQHLQHSANRIAARFSGHEGMAAQQRVAVQAIRLARNTSYDGTPVNRAAIAMTFMKTAVAEHEKRKRIRAGLNAQRQTNQLCASAPDRFRAQPGRVIGVLGHLMASDRQTQARQAAQSGRTLTADERASLPQDVKERLDAQDRKRSIETFISTAQQQHRSRDRGGGGRGR
jgi:hypothetical protein